MGTLVQLEERVIFSPDLPDEINRLLQAGVAASRGDKEQAQLQRFDPEDRSGCSVIESLASGLED
jgi:hypothetical protein